MIQFMKGQKTTENPTKLILEIQFFFFKNLHTWLVTHPKDDQWGERGPGSMTRSAVNGAIGAVPNGGRLEIKTFEAGPFSEPVVVTR